MTNDQPDDAMAGGLAAAEGLWRAVHAEFGLLTAQELSALLDSTPEEVRALYAAGALVAVHRGGRVLYPGFQVDPAGRSVRPVIGEMLRTAEAAGMTEASLIRWLLGPSGELSGVRPVDLLDEPARLQLAAAASFGSRP